ncbi:MAG: phage holin, lambda family [Halomonas sp.]|nr:phage holin, lambda family [Halomonas sp.]
MPWNSDPHWWPKVIAALWDWATTYGYAPALAFAIAVLRGLYAGGKPMRTLLEGTMIGLMTLALVPLLQYLELPPKLSIFLGSLFAFVGVEWVRERIDVIAKRYIDRIK